MPCAPLQSWEEPSSWTTESNLPTPSAYDTQEAVAITAGNDLERAYRMTLRENGLSAGEGVSLFDHMRAIGLLPSKAERSTIL